MNTGLEDTSEEALHILVHNLKVGILKVVDLGPKAHIPESPKECPPSAAFETNMAILMCFEAECHRRGTDFDAIRPDIREIQDMWLEARQ